MSDNNSIHYGSSGQFIDLRSVERERRPHTLIVRKSVKWVWSDLRECCEGFETLSPGCLFVVCCYDNTEFRNCKSSPSSVATTQEGCQSSGSGHDFDNFNCNSTAIQFSDSIVTCAKLIVSDCGISDQIVTGCDCVSDPHRQVHHGFRNVPEMFSLMRPESLKSEIFFPKTAAILVESFG